jgi:hypothetical protein
MFSKPGGKVASRRTPIIHPQNFLNYDIFYDQKTPNYLPKRCLQITPRKCIHECILLVLLLNVETVLSAFMNTDKKLLLFGHKNEPKPTIVAKW